MTEQIIRQHAQITFGDLVLTGPLAFDPGHATLTLYTDEGPEHFDVNLLGRGYTPELGNVYIKDWSEHAGLAEQLAERGLVRIVRRIDITQPFGTLHAYEVTPLSAVPADSEQTEALA